MIQNNRCRMVCNIDWLEVHCLEGSFAETQQRFEKDGYRLDIKPYGTRVYKQIIDVFTGDNIHILHICRDPYSMKGRDVKGVLPYGSTHIKVANAVLYMEDPVNALISFLNKYNYNFRGISRIDLCCDFQKFWNGTTPRNFLQAYIKDKYHKITQPNFQVHGTDKDTKLFHSIKWGAPSSKVKTRLYNKTKELHDVADKPYIRDVWMMAGLDPTVDTWRVEFEIGNQGKTVVDDETAEYVEINLNAVSDPDKVEDVFLKYATHYFKFTKAEGKKRKDRCKRMEFFPDRFEGSEYHPASNTPCVESNKTDRMVLNYLKKQVEDEAALTMNNKLTILNAMKVLIQGKRLTQWYSGKMNVCLPSECINPVAEQRRTPSELLVKPKDDKAHILINYDKE